MYKDIPLFGDIDKYLQEIGFEIWDLRTHRAYQMDNENGKRYIDKILNFKSGNNLISPQLVQGDALYFKRIELIEKSHFPYILIISCIYKAFDKFQSILEHGKSNLWINETEYQEWIQFAKQNFDKPKFSHKLKFLVDKLINKIFKFDPNDKRIFWTNRVFPDQ